jgi:3-hydroxybutyrate dehydrogenase
MFAAATLLWIPIDFVGASPPASGFSSDAWLRLAASFSRKTETVSNAVSLNLTSGFLDFRRPLYKTPRIAQSLWPMLLKGQVALITGSGRGIGRAIAKLFASEGADVFLTARTEKELEATGAEITQAGGRAAFFAADLAKEDDCRTAFAQAVERFGRVDILVNNGGHYGPVVPVEEYPMNEFDRVVAVHLRAAFLLSQLALPGMYERQHGVILNMSSISAKAAYSWGSAYAAAKAGLLGLTRYNAAEAARKGVRVNAICPGPVTETVMSKELGAVLALKLEINQDEQLAGFLQSILQGRGQTADEIAQAALFLCSEKASAITGQAVNVDGGAVFY